MSWLLSLLGRDKLVFELIDLFKDLLKDEYQNRTWTTIKEKLPPEKKILIFRDKGGYYLGHAEFVKGGKVEVQESGKLKGYRQQSDSIHVYQYGKIRMAIISEKGFDNCYWMEVGDPTGFFLDESKFENIDKKELEKEDRTDLENS